MDKVRIGVLGGGRGGSMIDYCKIADNAEVVAICDFREDVLNAQRAKAEGYDITFYDNFDQFILHDMDAVVLANYAHQHAPFAIKAMQHGKHVFSEVLPAQTLKQAVELIETVEQTGKIYAYGENYCYMPITYEMKEQYRQGLVGELEYAECEYVHNCEHFWHTLTYGEKDHWRNKMFSTFYCTHSFGPIRHITGLRPVSVVGFEGTNNARHLRTGSKSGQFGIEMVTLENGALVKSLHGGLYRDSYWFSIYGNKGRIECPRMGAIGKEYLEHLRTVCARYDSFDGAYDWLEKDYEPHREQDDKAKHFNHCGGDFYSMYHFAEKIKGNPEADIIDVYEAIDMWLPGIFAYRSILAGNIPMSIPDFRDPVQREQWRNDTACTDPTEAGDMLLPTFSKGTPEIDDEVYELMRRRWEGK